MSQTVPRLYTYAEAAEILRFTQPHVRRLVSQGRLNHRKLGAAVRFTETDLMNFIGAPITSEGAER